MTDKYCIRLARKGDMKAIKEIELKAATRFKGTGLIDELLDHHFEQELLKELIADGQVWVAEPNLNDDLLQAPDKSEHKGPVGFAIATVLGPLAYLEELDVLPDHGRQGLGRRLVETVAEWARANGFRHLTLSTFVDIAWNAPFYTTLGFAKLPKNQWQRELEEIHILEQKLGLPVEQRTFMRLQLKP
ncbi:MAG: GNAT family N-acetyltransferase [Candidatus Obscuribacterales bacterium]